MAVGRLAKGLAGLSAGERDVVLLVAYGGLNHAEVAAVLKIAEGTAEPGQDQAACDGGGGGVMRSSSSSTG
ncbi:sigma factor-like helix-turn-helix DNA-binding protein [Nonomuraea sp. NPDC050643]|uniref:RNA polymerase sigma factor n=1 Tax=Nonomuraea sp. NPDC050643 TaxID=3155660 RepID=UPI003411653D